MSLDIQQLFHKAVSNNDVETARRMIEAGADVNHFSTEEFPPIVEAVSHQTTDMVKLLLENGANPDLASTYGVSALVVSAETENLEMVQMLLHAGADPITPRIVIILRCTPLVVGMMRKLLNCYWRPELILTLLKH